MIHKFNTKFQTIISQVFLFKIILKLPKTVVKLLPYHFKNNEQ